MKINIIWLKWLKTQNLNFSSLFKRIYIIIFYIKVTYFLKIYVQMVNDIYVKNELFFK